MSTWISDNSFTQRNSNQQRQSGGMVELLRALSLELDRTCFRWVFKPIFPLFFPLSLSFFFFFPLFRAATAAYEISQARGLIRAPAAGLHHSHNNTRYKPRLWPTPQLPVSQARGFEHTSSWLLVRFITTEPQQELPRQNRTCCINFYLCLSEQAV